MKCIVCGINEIEKGNTPHSRRFLCSSGDCFNKIYEIAEKENLSYNEVWQRLVEKATQRSQ